MQCLNIFRIVSILTRQHSFYLTHKICYILYLYIILICTSPTHEIYENYALKTVNIFTQPYKRYRLTGYTYNN